METLNSVRASHLSFTRSTINRLSQDCVRLTDTFVEQLMCELLVLVASNAIVIRDRPIYRFTNIFPDI